MGRRAVGPLLVIALLSLCPWVHLTAQEVASNRSTAYLFPTDVQDARAIWVNPAGLGIQHEASLYGEFAVGDPGSKGKLRQMNIGFNSRGLAFSYQRDIFDNGQRGSTFRLGLGVGAQGFAAGFAAARYGGGGTVSTGWDIGTTYDAFAGALRAGIVAANIGQPIVRGLRQQATFIPGLTWRPGALQHLGLSADARITTDSVASYAFGAAWRTGGTGLNAVRWPIEVMVRLDTDRGLRRGAFAFGFSIGGQDRGGLIATTPGNVSSIDELSLYALSARQPAPGRP
jgi:hypothetical protein